MGLKDFSVLFCTISFRVTPELQMVGLLNHLLFQFYFTECTPPFMVGIFTNAAVADDGIAIENFIAIEQSRGFCLNYLQKPC